MDAADLPKSLRPYADKILAYSGPPLDEGHWITLDDAWYSPDMGCRTIHEYTLRDCVAVLRNVEPAEHADPAAQA